MKFWDKIDSLPRLYNDVGKGVIYISILNEINAITVSSFSLSSREGRWNMVLPSLHTWYDLCPFWSSYFDRLPVGAHFLRFWVYGGYVGLVQYGGGVNIILEKWKWWLISENPPLWLNCEWL